MTQPVRFWRKADTGNPPRAATVWRSAPVAQQAQAQGIELDETGGVLLVVCGGVGVEVTLARNGVSSRSGG